MKIMIVDDNEGMRDLIKDVLASPRNQFVECGDGGEAVSLYSQEQPDWVLMDMAMETVDGLTAATELGAMFPDSKVVMVTDYSDKHLKDRAREAGVTAYVVKDHLYKLPLLINASIQ